MTNPITPTTDLAARFEDKREKAARFCEEQSGISAESESWWSGFSAAFAEARDMAHAGAAGGAGEGYRELRAVLRQLSATKNAGGIEDAEAHAQVLGHAVDTCIGQIREFLAAAPPPPAQQGSSDPLSQGETAGQTCLDAAAAIEGVAQELDAYGRTAQGHMLRCALDVLLNVQPDERLPPPDASTKRIVDRAWARFQAATAAPQGATPTPDPREEAVAVLEEETRAYNGKPEDVLRYLQWRVSLLPDDIGASTALLARIARIKVALATLSAADQDGEARRG